MSTHTSGPALGKLPSARAVRRGPVPSWYDDLLAVLFAGAVTCGLAVDGAYRVSAGVGADFADVMRGQDVLTALTIPAFLLYVGILGLSVFGLPGGLFRLDVGVVETGVEASRSRGTGAFLIGVGVLFVVLWLSMVLPLLIATGTMLVRRMVPGVVLGTVMLTKIVTLGSAMLAMGLLFSDDPNPGEMGMWAVIAAVAVVLLLRLLRHVRTPEGDWMRGSLWR